MNRAITGFRRDEAGDWIAELSCGHAQHVRHRPPFEVREWVIVDADRAERIGEPLNCRLCDRAELPCSITFVRRSAEWTEDTVPNGLLRSHRIADGTWGQLAVLSGRVTLHADTEPPINLELEAGSTQAIPPGVEHEVLLTGPVRFTIDFFSTTTGGAGR